MNNKPLFQIFFEDQSLFQGGDLENTKWSEIPSKKKIKALFYLLPTGDYICLEGYSLYYQFIEVTKDIIGGLFGKKNLEYVYLIGKTGSIFRCYKINLKTHGIEVEDYTENDEFILKLNKDFWKKGI